MFLLAYLILASSPARALVESCRACHKDSGAEPECVRCHTASMFSDKVRRSNHLYRYAPPFFEKSLQNLKPFDPDGLRSYLKNPVARRHQTGSMFPLTDKDISPLLQSLSAWMVNTDFSPKLELVQPGQKLFNSSGCAGCHTSAKGPGPGLPIGVTLFNFQYFKRVVRGGKAYSAEADKMKIMPAYVDLSEASLQELYSYICITRPISEETFEPVRVTVPSPTRLYKSVTQIFGSNGCLHCHGPSAAKQATAAIFGGHPEGFLLDYHNGAIDVLPSPSLERHGLQKENRLVEVLRERVHEVYGKDLRTTRGMPLTLPPLQAGEIRLVKQWADAGCPTNEKQLCPRLE